jgi:Cu/Ag efflux protein CusF
MVRWRATALILGLVLAACSRSAPESKEPPRRYAMRGQVLRLDDQGHLATIKNEKIEGWMESMTMEFPVKDPQDFAKLHPGQVIRATVFVQGNDFWVGEVQPETPAPEAAPK